MTRRSTENDIFFEASEIADPIVREEFLVDRCEGDRELRKRVDSLLAAHDPAAEFFNRHQNAASSLNQFSAAELSGWQEGAVVGRYKLLQQLGEGGFGIVFAAKQEEPVQRMVALKLIKPGMDTRDIIARFEAERQALALMNHPHIASVLDAGTTDNGRPYFVMDLVKGTPITDFCDKRNLTTTQRLELFALVCDAVEHAHQKGVIHRDLKPSNILVVTDGGIPVPKVIDFGVAKAISQKLTEKTIFTRFGQLIGTPEYMSPEQADIDATDVDTRTDIYSLGIVLYELLTGSTPLAGSQLRSAGWHEMVRLIREEKTIRPSDRITKSNASSSIAVNRGINPTALRKTLRRELDWVILKAIDKERNRRYESANNFSADIQRYLNQQPVVARAPSTSYIVRKFVQRNRIPVVVAGMLLATLLSGLAGTSWAWFRATAATSREEQQRIIATDALDTANETSQQLTKTLYKSLLAQAQSACVDGRYDVARSLLERCDVSKRGWEWNHLFHRSKNREIVMLPGIGAPSFSPDSREVFGIGTKLTSNNKGAFWAWDVVSGKERVLFETEGWVATGSALSPDGKRFVMANHGSNIMRAYDTNTWKVVWETDEHASGNLKVNRINQILFSGDGKKLVTLQEFEVIRVFESESGQLISDCQTNGKAATAISPDGRLVAANGQVFDTDSGELVFDLDLRNIWCCSAFSHDGSMLATAGFNGRVRLCDATNGEFINEFPVQKGWTSFMLFHPSDRFIITGGGDSTLRVWDIATGRQLWTIGNHVSVVNGLAISPDGMRLVASGMTGRTLSSWNVFDRGIATLHRQKGRMSGVAFVPNRNQIAGVGFDGVMRLWDAASGQLQKTIVVDSESLLKVAVHPSGNIAATIAEKSPEIDVWDLQSGRRFRRLVGHRNESAYDLAFTPNGKYLLSIGFDEQLLVWDVQSGEVVRSMPCVGSLGQISISPDSRYAIAANAAPQKKAIWEIETGRLHAKIGSGSNTAMEFIEVDGDDSPLQVAVGTISPTIRFFDAKTGEPIDDSTGRDTFFMDFAYHKGVNRFWSASLDGNLTVRELKTHQEIMSIDAHGQPFFMSVSKDGKTLATASGDGTVKLFETEPISESVRKARAEVLAARMHVDARFEKLEFLKDVLASLDQSPLANANVHRRAVAIARARGDNAFELNRSCRRVVERHDMTIDEYRFARRQAKAAVKTAPDFVAFRTSLAIAQFRLGDYATALETIRLCDEMFAEEKSTRNPIPVGRQAHKDELLRLAYRAMSLYELGQLELARAELKRFESLLQADDWSKIDRLRAAYNEAMNRLSN